MQLTNFHLSLHEMNPNPEILLRFTKYPSYPHYPDTINTCTNPTLVLVWQIPQELTLRELKQKLAPEMNINGQRIILRRRGDTVGSWYRLDGDEIPLWYFVGQDRLRNNHEIRGVDSLLNSRLNFRNLK